jgi:hypothetical protein
MLDCWGYLYLSVGTAFAYAETALEHQRWRTGGALAGHGTSTLDPDSPDAHLVEHKCDEVLQLLAHHRDELEPLPSQVELLKVRLQKSRNPNQLYPYTNDILDEVRAIKDNFRIILSKQTFYYLSPSFAKFYGKPLLFGDQVAKKFPKAIKDIERAGNCLALGEPTACILHLNRAMEIAVRRLAKKLKFDPQPKDTLGAVLRDMAKPINDLPDKTEKLKRRKERWSECRANLFHVKNAWRDPSSHGKVSYTEKEALNIMQRMEEFMQQLATLL